MNGRFGGTGIAMGMFVVLRFCSFLPGQVFYVVLN